MSNQQQQSSKSEEKVVMVGCTTATFEAGIVVAVVVVVVMIIPKVASKSIVLTLVVYMGYNKIIINGEKDFLIIKRDSTKRKKKYPKLPEEKILLKLKSSIRGHFFFILNSSSLYNKCKIKLIH